MKRFATPQEYAHAVAAFLTPTARSRSYLDWLLAGETLELHTEADALIRAVNEAEDGSDRLTTLRMKFLCEAGDVLFALLVPDVSLSDDAHLLAHATALEVWERPKRNAWYAGRELRHLVVAVGDFASANAKEIREPASRARRCTQRREAAVRAISALSNLLWIFGYSLSDAAAANYAKLQDRFERGMICGDGSHR